MKNKLATLLVCLTASAAVAQTYTGNGQTGFGGPVGLGTLSFSDNGSGTVTGTLTNGNTGVGLNDVFVMYIDTTAGGFSDTSTFTDTGAGGDNLRKGISGFDGTNRSTLTFPTGFQADYAIALAPNADANFGGLWILDNPANFTFKSNLNLTPNNNPNATSYTFTLNLADLGLPTNGTFNFVTTYLNPNGAFRSNEAIGNHFTNEVAGNFGAGPATATGFSTFTASAVPEPSTLSLLAGPALLGGLFFVRRRRA
ncbi:MAG: PEP-CTERM sorting domain-containing protein [Chthoniobacterales bacterium]